MSEIEEGQKLIEQRITERQAAARLSLGPEFLPRIMALKICNGLLYDLGALLQADSLLALRENEGRAETWIECAGLFGELSYPDRLALLRHVREEAQLRAATLEDRDGVDI